MIYLILLIVSTITILLPFEKASHIKKILPIITVASITSLGISITWNEMNKNDLSMQMNNTNVNLIAFVFLFIILLYISHINKDKSATKPVAEKEYEIWPDLLRIVSAFIIVLLHATCNAYENQFNLNNSKWLILMAINCATAFGVPVFFMLSGALSLKKSTELDTRFKERIVRIIVQIVAWSSVYLVARKYFFTWYPLESFFRGFIGIIFSAQYYHLWFMYSLLGIYIMLPVVSDIYFGNSRKLKKYIFLIILGVPILLNTIKLSANIYLYPPQYILTLPEIGVFVLGGHLGNKKFTMLKNKPYMWLLVAALGLIISCVATYGLSYTNNEYNKDAFAIVSLPTLFMAIGVFMFFKESESKLMKISGQTKKIIRSISSVMVGVYFSHYIMLNIMGKPMIFDIANRFIPNEGSVVDMFFSTLITFIITTMFCLNGAQIPIVGKIFGEKMKF